jgi:hypothetical protein
MATLTFTRYFKLKESLFLNNRGTSLISDMFVLYYREYLIKNHPVPTNGERVSLLSNDTMDFYVCYWCFLPVPVAAQFKA